MYFENWRREAEKAKVLLGLENTISAEDNLRIMERSKSKAVKTYYDVGNSTNDGFDIIKELRLLGAKPDLPDPFEGQGLSWRRHDRLSPGS